MDNIEEPLAALMARVLAQPKYEPDWADRLTDRIERDLRAHTIRESAILRQMQIVRLMIHTTQQCYRVLPGGKREATGNTWRLGDLGEDWIVEQCMDNAREIETWLANPHASANGPENFYHVLLGRAGAEMASRISPGGPAPAPSSLVPDAW